MNRLNFDQNHPIQNLQIFENCVKEFKMRMKWNFNEADDAAAAQLQIYKIFFLKLKSNDMISKKNIWASNMTNIFVR